LAASAGTQPVPPVTQRNPLEAFLKSFLRVTKYTFCTPPDPVAKYLPSPTVSGGDRERQMRSRLQDGGTNADANSIFR